VVATVVDRSWDAVELAPEVPDELTAEQRIALWVDLLDACDEFLLAGVRREVGPEGDVKEAYRRWYARQTEEHDLALVNMAENFRRRLQYEGPRSYLTSPETLNALPTEKPE
jgi:hypothetical protein